MKYVLLAAAMLSSAAYAQGGQVVAPSNANPETDARGVTVISAPAEVPAGANQSAPVAPGAVPQFTTDQRAVFTPRPATENYPPCSRTVTDNCVQTYERPR
ncbi:MAG: hypothetical protein ACT4OE_00185 [Sphingosinicella sp.]